MRRHKDNIDTTGLTGQIIEILLEGESIDPKGILNRSSMLLLNSVGEMT